jgi:hypothetical protein
MPTAYETETCSRLAALTDTLLAAAKQLEAHMETVPEDPEKAMACMTSFSSATFASSSFFSSASIASRKYGL